MGVVRHVKKQAAVVRKIADSYFIYNLLTIKESKNISLVVAEAKKHKEICRYSGGDRAYFILKGSIKFRIGKNSMLAKPGDVVFLPKKTRYQFSGTFRAIIVNAPAFDRKYDETIVVN